MISQIIKKNWHVTHAYIYIYINIFKIKYNFIIKI